jgi:hypothetical protein
VKKSLGPSANDAESKVGDVDISTRLNIPIAKARETETKRRRKIKDLELSSTCSSAYPLLQCMNQINELVRAHEISFDTYFEAT